jgi:hypothetical protein
MESWSLRADGIFDYWSPETFAIFHFDPSQGIPTLTQWLAPVQPDGRDLLTRTIDKISLADNRGWCGAWCGLVRAALRHCHGNHSEVALSFRSFNLRQSAEEYLLNFKQSIEQEP